MANTILLKRAATAGKVPLAANVSLGELTINTWDGRLYSKKDTGSPVIVDLTQNDPITLGGDASGTSTNPSAGSGWSNLSVTLNTVNSNTGTWGGANGQIPYFVVNGKGLVTAAGNIALNTQAVTYAANSTNITANATVGIVKFDLTTTGVTAGNYGSSTSVPTVVVDAYGRVTSVTTNSISTSYTLAGTSGSTTVAGGSTLTLAGTYGVTVSVGAEYANIATPQDLRSTASPTFAGATVNGTIVASTVNAATLGNTGAAVIGSTGRFDTSVTTLAISAATVGNTGASVIGSTGRFDTSVTTTTLNAVTIGNSGATLTGTLSTASQPNVTTLAGVTSLGTAGVNTTSAGNFIVAGNLTVNGTYEYVNSIVTTHEDPILELNTGVNGAALTGTAFDSGIKTHYWDGTADRSAFFGRTNDSGYFEYYSNVSTESGNVISGTYGTIKTGNVVIASSTPSTSTTTGALVVTGGAGIAGALYVGGAISAQSASFASINNTPIGNSTPSTGAFTTLSWNTGTAASLQATAIGNVTPGTGAFTTLSASSNVAVNGGGLTTSQTTGYLFNETATTLNIGAAATAVNLGSASGTLTFAGTTITGTNTATVNLNGSNPTIATTSTGTVTLFNTNATTVNAFGAATTIGIGNSSGTTTISGVTKHTGNLVAAATTTSTSTTTGSIISLGGMGLAGNVNAGGYGYFGGIFTETSTTAGVFIGNTGTGTPSPRVGFFTGNASLNWQIDNYGGDFRWFTPGTTRMNLSAGGQLAVNTAITSTSTTTGSFVSAGGAGIAGNVVAGGQVQAANGVYSTGAFNGGYSDGVVVDYTSTLGRISVGTSDSLKFYNGGPAGTETFVIDSTGNIVIPATTTSSSTTTGALVVKGGAGIAGAVYAGSLYDNGNRTITTASSFGNVAGDVSVSGNYNTLSFTLSTVNATTGSFGNATYGTTYTVNGKGLITSAANVLITPAWGSITGTPTTIAGYGITDGLTTSSIVDGGTY